MVLTMKKTVIYHTIDGHKIITGFDLPTVDGVATTKAVNEAIKSTPEYAAAEAKKAEYAEAAQEFRDIKATMNSLTPSEMKRASREIQEKWNNATSKMGVRQDELKPIAADLKDKLAALRVSEAVYFEPRAGEVVRDASEIDTLTDAIEGKAKGVLITLDGDVIEDNRGKSYHGKVSGKWFKIHIVRLGDTIPDSAVTEPTETQALEIEVDRVGGLTDTVKAAERAKAMADAMTHAAGMRSELEIKEDSSALKKSQTWYKKEVKRIEGLYG